MTIKNVLICGIGAIGSIYAVKLLENKKCNLKILVDETRLERYKQNGLDFNDKKYDFDYTLPQNADNFKADLIIIAVKNSGLKWVIENIKNFLTKDTIIMSLLNGITSEDEILEEYNNAKVLYSYFVGHTSTRLGRKITFDGVGNIIFGTLNDKFKKEVEDVENFFKENNITFEIPKDINYARFCKYMMNVGLNQTSALSGASYKIFQQKGANYHLMLKLFEEVSLLAKAMGVKNYQNLISDALKYLDLMIPAGKSSMLQDILNGSKTEVEIFSKTIIDLGKKYNINVPYNQVVYDAICALEENINKSQKN